MTSILFKNRKESTVSPESSGKKQFLSIAILIMGLLTGCSSPDPISMTGVHFDTVITITIYDSQDRQILEECFELAAYYEDLFHKNREDSDVFHINHSNGQPVTVAPETLSLLQSACDYAALSGGAVDPSIGGVSALWDFQHTSPPALPDQDALQAALLTVDYTRILMDGESNTITLKNETAMVDPGFIAKGYIADRLAEFLARKGIQNALINLGGNIRAIGTKPGSSGYRIGIQQPFEATGTSAATLTVSDCSIVTAGTYERYFTYEGTLYHHILSTETGYPVHSGLSSVTILSESSIDGDALSTLCLILGPDQGMDFLKSFHKNVGAVFITEDNRLHTWNIDSFAVTIKP